MKNISRFMLITMVLVVLLASVSIVGAQDDEGTLVMISGPSDVPTIDPNVASDTQSNLIIEHGFVTLAKLNEVTGELEPGLATSWESEGPVYTFHLMEGIPWVFFNTETGAVEEVMDDEGNVRYVTAHDVVYGVNRMINPDNAFDYAYVAADWVAGVEAVDDYTVQFTSTREAAFAPMVLGGLWFMSPLPSWSIEANGDAWTDVGNYNTYGPYTVSEWVHDDHVTLVKNPFWPGTEYTPQGTIERVQLLILDDSTAYDGYLAGNVDVVAPPLEQLASIKADPVLSEQLFIGPDMCTYYYGFNVTKEPFDNVHLRRALSFAVNRQSLIDNVTQGGQEAAQWFSRPGLVAAPTMDSHPDLGVWYDPEIAQEELALALADLGLTDVSELPAMTITHNTSQGHTNIATAIAGMWAEELGLNVEITSQEWAVYLDAINNDPPQIFRLGWCQDYPDANNFLNDVFHSGSTNNHTMWGNEEFDQLMADALVATDTEERLEMYARAEEILVYEDAAIIPMYWYTIVSMTQPNVERTFAQYGQNRLEKWSLGGN